MRRFLLTLAAGSLLIVGCGDSAPEEATEKPISAIQAFPNVPLPPNGRTVRSSGTGDALELVMASPAPDSSVVTFYRTILAKPPYRLINESSASGVTTFYVESGENRPLWVYVQADSVAGTEVRLVGTAPPSADSAAPKPDTVR